MMKQKSILVIGRIGSALIHRGVAFCVVFLLAASALPLLGEIRSETFKLRVVAVSESQIALTWTIPAGAVSYRIYRDGALLRITGRISEYDAGLKAGTGYCYRISAVNDQNYEFSRSNEACAITLMAEAAEPSTGNSETPSTGSCTSNRPSGTNLPEGRISRRSI